ncbi:hypothetical protein G6F60_014320 [Rhizopus arrhizus]|nr:hypothetical protein G6F60_014320 [Rhizopus arrhizus]
MWLSRRCQAGRAAAADAGHARSARAARRPRHCPNATALGPSRSPALRPWRSVRATFSRVLLAAFTVSTAPPCSSTRAWRNAGEPITYSGAPMRNGYRPSEASTYHAAVSPLSSSPG